MNLSAYDSINSDIDKSKPYVLISYKSLTIPNITYRDKYILLRRYSKTSDDYSYFVCICDNDIEGYKTKFTRKNKDNDIVISLSSIWKDTFLADIKDNINIDVTLVDKQDDGEIYELDI